MCIRDSFYASESVLSEKMGEQGQIELEVRMQRNDFEKILRQAGVPEGDLVAK